MVDACETRAKLRRSIASTRAFIVSRNPKVLVRAITMLG